VVTADVQAGVLNVSYRAALPEHDAPIDQKFLPFRCYVCKWEDVQASNSDLPVSLEVPRQHDGFAMHLLCETAIELYGSEVQPNRPSVIAFGILEDSLGGLNFWVCCGMSCLSTPAIRSVSCTGPSLYFHCCGELVCCREAISIQPSYYP
jgi:hypothetical protein